MFSEIIDNWYPKWNLDYWITFDIDQLHIIVFKPVYKLSELKTVITGYFLKDTETMQ